MIFVDKPFEHFLLMNYMIFTRVISLMSVKIGPVYARTMEMKKNLSKENLSTSKIVKIRNNFIANRQFTSYNNKISC